MPAAVTVATIVFEEDQATVRSVSTLPEASRRTAVAVVVRPAPTLELPSDTATVATGAGCVVPPEPHADDAAARRRAIGERLRRKLGSGFDGRGGAAPRPIVL
jgi:hypothetical protein